MKLAMKMAKTDPKILDGWQGVALFENDISAAWSGAYQIFRGVWNTGVTFDRQTASALKQSRYQTMKASPKVAATPEAPEQTEPSIPAAQTSPYYVVKKAPVAPHGRTKPTHWTQVTYLKLQYSSYWNKELTTYPAALTNVLTEWADVVTLLYSRDPKCTTVLGWSDRDFGRAPLRKESTKQMTKEGVQKVYTDEFFIATRPGTQFLRFRLGHTKPIAFYLESATTENGLMEDSSLHVDKIQDSNVSITGWGAGPVVGRGTIDDTEEMLKRHPLFTSNQIKYLEL
jgi:hypothetical protein